MARTLLQIIVAAQQELGLTASSPITTVIGNTDPTTVQMLSMAQAEVDELRQIKEGGWTDLQQEYNIVISPPTTTTGNLTLNSAVITGIPSTAALAAQYWQISGTGIPIAARIKSVDSATQVTMTMQATGTVSGTSLVFSQDTYPEPSDFAYFIGNTWFDRTNRWRLLGPDSPQQDQFVRSGIVALGPRRHFRQLGPLANNYRIWPPPSDLTVPIQLVYEYVSNAAIATAGSLTNRSQFFTADTDIPLVDDRAVIMGVKYRFWAQKGFNYASLQRDHDLYVDRLMARDGGTKTLSLVPRVVPFLQDASNVQDSNFPGPTGPNSN